MKLFCILVSSILFSIGVSGAEEKIDLAKLSPQTVLRAISRFQSEPLKAKSNGILSIIINFADESQNVYIEVNSGYMPWLKQKKNINNTDILLVSFVAGNMRPQLINKEKKDHPVEGMIFMLRIYNKLRKAKKIEAISTLDQWSTLSVNELRELIPKIKEPDSD